MEFYQVKVGYMLEAEDKLIFTTKDIVIKDVNYTGAEVSANKIIEDESLEHANVMEIKKFNILAVVFDSDAESDIMHDLFFLAKIGYFVDTGGKKPKRVTERYLVNAGTLLGAHKILESRYTEITSGKTEIEEIKKTKIVDTYEFE